MFSLSWLSYCFSAAVQLYSRSSLQIAVGLFTDCTKWETLQDGSMEPTSWPPWDILWLLLARARLVQWSQSRSYGTSAHPKKWLSQLTLLISSLGTKEKYIPRQGFPSVASNQIDTAALQSIQTPDTGTWPLLLWAGHTHQKEQSCLAK